MELIYSNDIDPLQNMITNNFISIDTNRTAYGIYDLYSRASFYNNSVLLNDTGSASVAMTIYNTDTFNFENNILANTGKGQLYVFYPGTGIAPRIKMDHNDYFFSGIRLGIYNGTTITDLDSLKKYSHNDSNSISVNPQFVSVSDLHVNNDSLNVGLYLSAVPTDIDGQTRRTINPTIGADEIWNKVTSCMSGIYTIGGISPNYATFNAAVTDLKTYGICGPVTFNIADGTYTEQVQIPFISGTSSANTITFQSAKGDSSKVILTWPASYKGNNYTLNLNNARNINIKGITIERSGGDSLSRVIFISDSCTNVNFSNNFISGQSINYSWGWAIDTFKSLVFANSFCSNIIFKSNRFTNGTTAVSIHNGTNILIQKNILNDFGFNGVSIQYSDNTVIANNSFYSHIYHGIVAINLQNLTKVLGITKNTIDLGLYGYGINIVSCNGDSANPMIIANNFIVVLGVAGYAGYDIEFQSISNINFIHNTISGTGGGFYDAGGKNCLIYNNLINCTGSVYFNKKASNVYLDNNCYYTIYSVFAQWNGATAKNLADFQSYTGQDIHSISQNTTFYSSTDLHVTDTSLNHGKYFSSVPTDIDGDLRNHFTPTIGADELPHIPKTCTAGFSNVSKSCRGDSAIFTDSSTYLGTDTITNWTWSFGDGNTSSNQNPKHQYLKGGYFTVKLIVATLSGSQDTATHSIFIDSTCVWPGDANANRVANSADVLSIGVAYGDTGSWRPSASTSWYAQPCRNWVDTFANGVNQKNADCNGDGVVDSYDVRVVSLNYGFTHLKKSGLLKGGPTDPVLTFDIPKDSFLVGDTMHVGINLGTAAIPAKNIYGIAFKMVLDSQLVDTSTMTLDLSNSWLGTNTNTIHLVKEFFSSGYADVAICRIDHKNISGSGNIGTLNLVVKDDIAGKKLFTKVLKMTYLDAMIIDNVENEIPLNLASDSTVIAQYLGINENSFNANSIAIYPNPARDMFTVDAKGIKISKLQLLNTIGQTIWEESNVSGNLQVNTRQFPAGIYILQGISQHGTFSKKIIIEK